MYQSLGLSKLHFFFKVTIRFMSGEQAMQVFMMQLKQS